MTNIEFAKSLLRNINFDFSKLNPEFVCDAASLASEEEINQMFGSFADMRAFIATNIKNGTITVPGANTKTTPNANAEEEKVEDGKQEGENNSGEDGGDNTAGSSGDGNGQQVVTAATKTVRVMKHDGTIMKCKAPADMNLKDILAAAGVDTEAGFDVRVNNEEQSDVFSVPEDGALITATRQTKGNNL